MQLVSNWKALTNEHTTTQLKDESHEQPVVIFKHSTTCGISASIKHRLEHEFEQLEGKVSFYYLDLLKNRAMSNAIAKEFDVTHQSPQIIVINNGSVVHHRSHQAINTQKILEAIQ